MSFAVPIALMLAALALPIIALYILKVRLRRIPVSTNLFWKQVYDEKPPRSLWQNLRHLLSLLAQLLLLMLLVFAIADPYFSWQALQARRLVIVLDTSASMRATDIAPSRFDAARKASHEVLDGLRARDQVAIVSAGSRPEVVLGMAGHVPTLRRAIDSIQLTDAGSSLEAAVELAKQLIGDDPHGQVLVFTDGCAQRPDPAAAVTSKAPPASSTLEPETKESTENIASTEKPDEDRAAVDRDASANAVDVQYRIFSSPANNVGITQFQARRSLIDPIGYEILVKVHNASNQSVKGRLELELDGIPIDVIPLALEPEAKWSHVIEKTSLEGGQLKASLTQLANRSAEPADRDDRPSEAIQDPELNGLPTDDAAWAIVPARVVQDVLIVSPGNLFLQKVFEANPLVNVTVRTELPEQWPADTIVVCHRLVPETLPPGHLLVVDPETSCDLWEVGELIETPLVTQQDEDSPLMTHVRMDNVLMPEARHMNFKTPPKSLAETVTGESVYASIDRPRGDCLVLSVNLERSDLAFRTAFPILITNALNWFAGQPGELEPSIAAGHMARLRTGDETASSVDPVSTVTSDAARISPGTAMPENQRILVSPSDHASLLLSHQVGPLNEIGIWSVIERDTTTNVATTSVPPEGELLQRVAVNLANANESDLRPWQELSSNEQSSIVSGSWFTRPIWFYLIVTACLLSTLEWFLYQRRFIS